MTDAYAIEPDAPLSAEETNTAISLRPGGGTA